jgi:hypothetical protein
VANSHLAILASLNNVRSNQLEGQNVMATEEKQSIGQMIDNVKESIRLKWVELQEHLTSPEQRKALRAEINDALAGLGKTLKQFAPKPAKQKKNSAAKKKPSAKKKSSSKKSKKNVPAKSAKKK